MELSKTRYTYGTSYEGRFYFRWDNKINKAIFVDPHKDFIGIEFNNTTKANSIENETSKRVSKSEFLKAVAVVQKHINAIK